MAWVTSSNLSTGDLVTASEWNQAVVANSNALRAGTIAMDSQAAGDVVYASSATQFARVAIGSANKVLTSNGSIPAWVTQIANAAMPTNVDLAGSLDVTNATTLDSTLDVAGATTLSSTLGVVGSAVFNDAGADKDFRIESSGNANMMVVDGGLNSVSFGLGANDYIRYTFAGAFTSGGSSTSLYGFWNASALTGHSGDSAGIAGMRLDTSAVTAGNATLIAQLSVNEPQITTSHTVTNAATLYVQGAPTEGTNNFAVLASETTNMAYAIDDGSKGLKYSSTVDGLEYRGYAGHIWMTGTNGATERMRIDSSGRVLIGGNASVGTGADLQVAKAGGVAAQVSRWSNDAGGPNLLLMKSRASTVGGSPVIVADDDPLGFI
ncbi:MAG: hypothetical protein VX246_13980, partial [Myxococcota bacterium]|nr:hypothetical protein [Myxococcota bacterium]